MVTTRIKRRRMEEASRPTLLSILPNLVDSGFVRAAELGLLCQTSKELWRATYSDELWASLCLQLWPVTEVLPRRFVALQGGHRGLYKLWISGAQDHLPNPNPMPPPAYPPQQIQLFVNIKYKGKQFLSHSLCPKGLDILLKHGGVASTLKQPIILCEAEWYQFENCKERYLKGELPDGLFTWGRGLDIGDFQELRMHVRTGPSMCCVFEGNGGFRRTKISKIHPLIKESQELSKECGFDLSRPQSPCRICFKHRGSSSSGYEGLALRHTPAAAEIKSRVSDRLGFEFVLLLSIVEGGYYAVTGCEIWFVKVDHRGDSKKFDASKEQNEHGVTPLHILSELQGTDSSPEHFKP